jgi:hypothetical protein
MIIGILLSLALLAAVILAINKLRFFQIPSLPKSWIWAALALKLMAAILLTGIYTYHYQERSTADIYKYYDDAVELKKAHQNQQNLFWETFLPLKLPSKAFKKSLSKTMHWDSSSTFILNDNRSLIRFNYLLLQISGGFYLFHLLVFCLLSFLGGFALFKFFQSSSQLPTKILFLAIFGIPSLLFWSSAMLKESLLLFNLGFLLLSAKKLFLDGKKSAFLPFLLFLLLSITIKVYVLLALIVPFFFYLLSQQLARKHQLATFIFFGIPFLAFFAFLKNHILQTLKEKLIDFKAIARASEAGSLIEMPSYENFSDLIQRLPLAWYNVFIHPIFPPHWNLLSAAAALEHLALVGLLFLPLFAFKRNKNDVAHFWFCLSFVLILAAVIGLTTPVLGAIVRYKVPLIPFYVIAVLTFVDLNKISLLKKLK